MTNFIPNILSVFLSTPYREDISFTQATLSDYEATLQLNHTRNDQTTPVCHCGDHTLYLVGCTTLLSPEGQFLSGQALLAHMKSINVSTSDLISHLQNEQDIEALAEFDVTENPWFAWQSNDDGEMIGEVFSELPNRSKKYWQQGLLAAVENASIYLILNCDDVEQGIPEEEGGNNSGRRFGTTVRDVSPLIEAILKRQSNMLDLIEEEVLSLKDNIDSYDIFYGPCDVTATARALDFLKEKGEHSFDTFIQILDRIDQYNTAHPLTPALLSMLKASVSKPRELSFDQLNNQQERTLFVATKSEGVQHIIHVYLQGGHLHVFEYNSDHAFIEHCHDRSLAIDVILQDGIVINPSKSDGEFAALLATYPERPATYGKFEGHLNTVGQYHAHTHRTLLSPPKAFLAAKTVALALQDYLVEMQMADMWNALDGDEKLIALNKPSILSELNNILAPILALPQSLVEQKTPSKPLCMNFKKAMRNPLVIKLLRAGDFSQQAEFERIYSELLHIEITFWPTLD